MGLLGPGGRGNGVPPVLPLWSSWTILFYSFFIMNDIWLSMLMIFFYCFHYGLTIFFSYLICFNYSSIFIASTKVRPLSYQSWMFFLLLPYLLHRYPSSQIEWKHCVHIYDVHKYFVRTWWTWEWRVIFIFVFLILLCFNSFVSYPSKFYFLFLEKPSQLYTSIGRHSLTFRIKGHTIELLKIILGKVLVDFLFKHVFLF